MPGTFIFGGQPATGAQGHVGAARQPRYASCWPTVIPITALYSSHSIYSFHVLHSMYCIPCIARCQRLDVVAQRRQTQIDIEQLMTEEAAEDSHSSDSEQDNSDGTHPEPFNSTPMAANPISSGSPHVRPMGVHRTCGARRNQEKIPTRRIFSKKALLKKGVQKVFAMCFVKEIRPTFQAVRAIMFWSGGLQFRQ